MGSTYRRPICGGRMKRAPLPKPYEEDPFEIMRAFWIVSLQRALFGYGRGSMQGAFLKKAPFRGPCLNGFFTKSFLD